MAILESMNFLDSAQFSFREQRNTISAIKDLKRKIRDHLRNYIYSAASSLDISEAFHNLNWYFTANIIDSLPIPNYLKSILKKCLSDRQVGFSFVLGII